MESRRYEMNGYAQLVDQATHGTVHSLPEPPDRADFDSDEDFDREYERWYWNTVSWSSTFETKD